jgi:hypothetical protein
MVRKIYRSYRAAPRWQKAIWHLEVMYYLGLLCLLFSVQNFMLCMGISLTLGALGPILFNSFEILLDGVFIIRVRRDEHGELHATPAQKETDSAASIH